MQEDPSLIILLSTLIFLLILSGFFSGSETGMMAANKIKLKNLSKKSKTSAKRALNLLKRPDQLLSASKTLPPKYFSFCNCNNYYA